MSKVPIHCEGCLNKGEYGCRALKEFNPKSNCFARNTDPVVMASQISAMQIYLRRYNRPANLSEPEANESIPKGLSAAGTKGPVERQTRKIASAEIHAAFFEDTHRGKRGGGGEQEKAPHKKKKGNKSTVWSWDEL